MKYFTPELFTALNSEDRAISRAATADWDRAVAAYERHLKSIRRKLPTAVRRLEAIHLHDAEFIDFKELAPRSRNPVAQLMVRQQSDVVVLSYFLLERAKTTSAVCRSPFSDKFVHWLYDEIDVRANSRFIHEILWSDGSTQRFEFEHLAILSAQTQPKRPRRRKATA